MEEDESTNQNPVKKQDFLWITGEFHFGNEDWSKAAKGRQKNPGPFAAPEILNKHSMLLDVQSNVINHE